jgi:tRNA threonylcarbamoyladenosine biosynthesis protein TsaB
MKILAITTSTTSGGAAIVESGSSVLALDLRSRRSGRVLGARRYVDLAGHAERIFSAIDGALADAGLARSDIEAIACDTGPGSFTGVRVGVAAAKGIALALGVPVVGAGSLEVMAHEAFASLPAESDVDAVFAVLDAKKGEAFVAAYDRSGREILAPCNIATALIAERALGIPGKVAATGEMARSSEALAQRLVPPGVAELPDARFVALVGSARGAFVDAAALEPVYARPPDAKPMSGQGGA